jgi:hypothetical protein
MAIGSPYTVDQLGWHTTALAGGMAREQSTLDPPSPIGGEVQPCSCRFQS